MSEPLWYPTVFVPSKYFETHCCMCNRFHMAYLTDDMVSDQVVACNPGPKDECIPIAKNWYGSALPHYPDPEPRPEPPPRPPRAETNKISPGRKRWHCESEGKTISPSDVCGFMKSTAKPRICINCGADIGAGVTYVASKTGPVCLTCSINKIAGYKYDKARAIIHCRRVM
jgi:hypothetical protein